MSLDIFTPTHTSLRQQNGRLALGTCAVRNLDDEAISCLMFVTVLLSQFRDHYLQTEQMSATGFSPATQIIMSQKSHCMLSTIYSCQTDTELSMNYVSLKYFTPWSIIRLTIPGNWGTEPFSMSYFSYGITSKIRIVTVMHCIRRLGRWPQFDQLLQLLHQFTLFQQWAEYVVPGCK